ncbi:MAG: Mrp/NBP35 family ATP-binding protein [Candidatus Thiodiazotropha sp. (ex Dulcina madagascariensis)]|nr:Mrp/NBP35 family ATP-binding protein [Candidatus Thiodiazotropha sp. (ex Dulcina madagascariensis)]MCU7925888.1 Mrp/NBP35 family ATP-binding protein [Candidatus Thiodiazotropha sp. (ex Dulcina madagascariensis)]
MSKSPEFPLFVQSGSGAAAPDSRYAEPHQPVEGVESIVLVASGKGGVGKSTLTVNLACTLSQMGKRIGILDADLYGPSITRMMGADTQLSIDANGRAIPVRNHGVWTASVGNQLPPEAALVWKGPLVAQTLIQMFRHLAWPELDMLLVDLPPGTGDVPLTILEQIPITGTLLVTTPQKLSLVDAARGVALFHDLDIPVFGLVENMDRYICPCCGESQDLFPDGAAAALAERKHIPFLGGIPFDPEGQCHIDNGHPLVIAKSEGEVARAFKELAAKVDASVAREIACQARDGDARRRQEHVSFWENLLHD